MPVPTHGPLCRSWNYQVACRFCSRDIWIFHCVHGSTVLFDHLGHPWPKHTCSDPDNEGGIGGSGLSGWEAVETIRAQGIPITPEIIEKIFLDRPSKVHHFNPEDKTVAVVPQNRTTRDIAAVVREIHTDTGRIRSVKQLPKMGYRILGLDPTERYHQITLIDSSLSPNESFTALIPAVLTRNVEKGMVVQANLIGHVGGKMAVWVISRMELL